MRQQMYEKQQMNAEYEEFSARFMNYHVPEAHSFQQPYEIDHRVEIISQRADDSHLPRVEGSDGLSIFSYESDFQRK